MRARAVAELQARAFAPAALIPSPRPSPASGRGSAFVSSYFYFLSNSSSSAVEPLTRTPWPTSADEPLSRWRERGWGEGTDSRRTSSKSIRACGAHPLTPALSRKRERERFRQLYFLSNSSSSAATRAA
ncbi:hypothetical protein [Lysobacter gummosus]|uniref:hypothetical protein n=1 Tax=Lysobacter gummosus TaxID=262324 RepID=UPI0036336AD9